MSHDVQILKDRYKIKQELAKGETSTTYLAIDLAKRRYCAVKHLILNRADSWETIELFQRQASILANLDHPYIPAFIDEFTEESDNNINLYIVQDYINGKNLAELVESGKFFTENEAIQTTVQLAEILKYLHQFSPPLVHRSVKPNNIMIGNDGMTYLVDFGAVKDKMIRDSKLPESELEQAYGYIPLEQIEGAAAPASDIYALGASMIYALSHVDPRHLESMDFQIHFKSHVNISDEFAAILSKMVAPDLKDRYQNATALLDDLTLLQQGKLLALDKSTSSPKPTFNKKLAVAVMSAIILIVFGLLTLKKSPSISCAKLFPVSVAASSLFTDKKIYQPYEPITVSYKGLPGNKQDWITIVPSNASNQTYQQWFYTDGKKRGEMRFNGLQSGDYEARLYYDWPKGDYIVKQRYAFSVKASTVKQAESNASVTTNKAAYLPQEPIIVSFSGLPGNQYDWITVVPANASPQTYQEWFYTNAATSGQMNFKGLPAGAYEVRVYYDWPNGGYKIQQHYAFSVVESNENNARITQASDLKIKLFYDGQPIRQATIVEPTFEIYNNDAKIRLYPKAVFSDGYFTLKDIPPGKTFLSVDVNANQDNLAERYPGDFYQQLSFNKIPNQAQIYDVNLIKIIHLTTPQDNYGMMKNTGSANCSFPAKYEGDSITFAWESLGDNVVYEYKMGTVDCIRHFYHGESIAKGETNETTATFKLLPSKPNETYAFHVMAKRRGELIGRLYIHDEGGSNWNYGFAMKQKPTGTEVKGLLMYDGKPTTLFTAAKPYFWFRNEEKNIVETPITEYEQGAFRILDLPVGAMGMSVDFDANPSNPRMYPGDLRTWTTFSVFEKNNPEQTVHLSQIIHLTHPQDNNAPMERWGAPCMELISLTSPVLFQWKSLGAETTYSYKIMRLNCENHYNSIDMVLENTIETESFTAELPPSRENECYGFMLQARRNGRQIGIFMSHGDSGHGSDYRFRIVQ